MAKRKSTRSLIYTHKYASPKLVGAILLLIAVGTLICVFSTDRGVIVSLWLDIITFIIGLNVYTIGFVLIALAHWLIRYYSQASEQEKWEKPTGVILFLLTASMVLDLYSGRGGILGYYAVLLIVHIMGFIGTLMFIVLLSLITTILVSSLSLKSFYNGFLYSATKLKRLLHAIRLPRRPASLPIPNKNLPILSEILTLGEEPKPDQAGMRKRIRIIEDTLAGYDMQVKVRETFEGPTVTQFCLEPEHILTRTGEKKKVQVRKIIALKDDLALALATQTIRIEAPIPGRPYVGIEIPNNQRRVVSLCSILESPAFVKHSGMLKLAIGQDVKGQAVIADLTEMPHLLIAGATGSGKSVCINAIIASLLAFHEPETLRLILIDPKMVELVGYNGIPHLLREVVVDTKLAVGSMEWACKEMDRRYEVLHDVSARNIKEYNKKNQTMSYIVIIIDELADLILTVPDEIETMLIRLAQKSRAVGIHLILATQRPTVNVVTGLIKANFPARIAFAVASHIDSRVILDAMGAEMLLGKGDLLFMHESSHRRVQGAYVTDPELQRLVSYWQERM